MSLSQGEKRSIDEKEFENQITEICETLQKAEEIKKGPGETGGEDEAEKKGQSFFDKILQWWEMMKAFFKKLSKKVADFFWRHSGFFAGVHRGFSGVSMANFLASLNFLIRIGGRAKSTILTIHNSTLNSIGNPTWWIRYDGPHRNVPFNHTNINPKVSGVPDPHSQISEFNVAVVEFLGPTLKFLHDIAPYLMAVKIAIDAGCIGYSVYLDFKNKSTRNTIKTVLGIFLSTIGGVGGFHLGCFLGSMVMPGIGTILGALIIGALGGIGLGLGGDIACDWILDRCRWDIYHLTCQNCGNEFVNRRYEEGYQARCNVCRDH